MARLIIILTLLSSLICKSQESNLNTNKKPVDSTIKKEKIIIKWVPTALVGYYPALQFAAEFFYTPKKSIQVEYGWMNPLFDMGEIGENTNRGHRIRIEQRNYFSKNKAWYIAPELQAQIQKYYFNDWFVTKWGYDTVLHTIYASERHREDVGVRKIVTTANLKIGYEPNPEKLKRIAINVYFGLGLRYTNTKWIPSPTGELEIIDPGFSRYAPGITEGNKFTFNVVAGIQVGYLVR